MKYSAVVAILSAVVIIICAVLSPACAPNQEPLERVKADVLERIIAPAVENGIAQLGSSTAQLQGQGSMINPGYRSRGYGIIGTGIVWDGTIEVVGVSANIAGATQGGTASRPE